MSFKIHSKLNRATELERTLENLARQIGDHRREAYMHRRCERLLQLEYLMLEMEYSKLIGEPIDNTEMIDVLKSSSP